MSSSGHCLCEGVRFRVSGALRPVVNCHCEDCRRTTGHFLAATAAHRDDVIIESDETLAWYRPADNEVKYGFCQRCGGTVFWHTDANPEFVSIAAGMLNTPTELETHFALNTHEASDYYTLDATIARLDEEAGSAASAAAPAATPDEPDSAAEATA